MQRVGHPLRRNACGGKGSRRAERGRRRAAASGAVAALFWLSLAAAGCETVPGAVADGGVELGRARADLRTGLDLYTSAEYALAAARFRAAVAHANAGRDRALAQRALTAECTAWLRSHQIAEFAACSERLERGQRRERRSDPGVNTLIAMGAIAGQRPLPALRIPQPVQSLVRRAAVETPR